MKGRIVSSDEESSGHVRSLLVQGSAPFASDGTVESRVDPELLATRAARETAERRAAALSDELNVLRQNYAADLARAKAAAFDEAKAGHVRDDEARLKALTETLRTSQTMLDQSLAEFEQVATLIAKSALAPVFSDENLFVERVACAIWQQVSGLKSEVVLSVRVRPDTGLEFTELASRLQAMDLGSVQLLVGPRSMAHEVQIDLKMGQIEIGIDDYWAAVESRLNGFVGLEPGQ
jgi:hypothetical protein